MKLWSLFNHPFPHCSWRNKNTCLQPDSCEWYKDHLKDIMKINWKELRCLITSWKRKKEWMNERKKEKSLSCVWLFATPWTVAHQAPPSMEFSRQEYWSGLPFPSPEKATSQPQMADDVPEGFPDFEALHRILNWQLKSSLSTVTKKTCSSILHPSAITRFIQ